VHTEDFLNERNDTKANENQQKRVWQAPVMEELAVTSTEAAYIPGAPADLGIYTV
jgi:hypothetical protein